MAKRYDNVGELILNSVEPNNFYGNHLLTEMNIPKSMINKIKKDKSQLTFISRYGDSSWMGSSIINFGLQNGFYSVRKIKKEKRFISPETFAGNLDENLEILESQVQGWDKLIRTVKNNGNSEEMIDITKLNQIKLQPIDHTGINDIVNDPYIMNFFRAGKDPKYKDDVINLYGGLVKYIYLKHCLKAPLAEIKDDILQSGKIGLIESLKRYKPNEFKFKTYAYHRIKGAMKDLIRDEDPLSKDARKKVNKFIETEMILCHEKQEMPLFQEVVKEAKIKAISFDKLFKSVYFKQYQIGAPGDIYENNKDSENYGYISELEDLFAESPDTRSIRNEYTKFVAEQIDKLPPKEKLVLSLYFYENLILREIAGIMDLSESRVSQIKTKAENTLKTIISKHFDDFF